MKKTKTAPAVEVVNVSPVPEAGVEGGLLETLKKIEAGGGSLLAKRMLHQIGEAETEIDRLAFKRDPIQENSYGTVYAPKVRLLPDNVLKRIAIGDDLIAAIANARSNHLSVFGAPRPDRFSYGFKIQPRPGIASELNSELKAELKNKIERATRLLVTCGNPTEETDRCSLKEFLKVQSRNAIILGRFATEIIHKTNPNTGQEEFHAFRYIDAGTIYRATKQQTSAETIRQNARRILDSLKDEKSTHKIDPNKFANDEYRWIQVIEGQPRQAFTDKECVVVNCYPVSDYELEGYPVTPIDTVINHVVTHINIVNHNRLYFQAGRASRGMLVIQSSDITEREIAGIRQQFNASINSVSNAWRMPVFQINPEDKITWSPIDSGTRDMEFQYLSDTNSRVILSAFQMSPEELPGYAHLSRGTANQGLSESNNSYQLTAHRDVGLRPLIGAFESFLNETILPLIDPQLAKLCTLKLLGLEADTAEKESVRFQTDMPIHMTFDEVLQRVEKRGVGKAWAGEFFLNPQWQAVLDKYFFVGEIQEYFFGKVGAAKDPRFAYIRDPFYFQNLQLQISLSQMQQQGQQGGGGGGGGGGGTPSGGGGGGESGADGGGDAQNAPKNPDSNYENAENSKPNVDMSGQGDESAPATDLTRSIDKAVKGLSKAQKARSPILKLKKASK
jgi:hypothetical protein